MDSEGSSGRWRDGVFWAIPSAQEMLFFRYHSGGCAVYPEVLIKPASWGDLEEGSEMARAETPSPAGHGGDPSSAGSGKLRQA